MGTMLHFWHKLVDCRILAPLSFEFQEVNYKLRFESKVTCICLMLSEHPETGSQVPVMEILGQASRSNGKKVLNIQKDEGVGSAPQAMKGLVVR